MAEKRDYYEVLGVKKDATADEIKKAYRKVTKENHPDLHPGDKACEERFKEIYGRDSEGLSFCPYRICPIGAHSDHNLGKITGIAIAVVVWMMPSFLNLSHLGISPSIAP